MSRKDFERIARLFAARLLLARGMQTERMRVVVLRELAGDAAKSFEEENPRFNRELFLTACGFTKEEREYG